MSGPCTLEYLLIQATLLGAQAAIKSGLAVHSALADSRRDTEQALQQRSAESRAMRQRERDAAQGLKDRIAALEAGLQRLATLAETIRPTLEAMGAEASVAQPEAPGMPDRASLQQYGRQLEEAMEAAQQRLAAAGANLAPSSSGAVAAETLERLARPRSVGELIEAYAEANRQEAAARTASERKAKLTQLLSPLEQADALPPAIEALVREMAATPNDARADALALELRREVSAERARRARAAAQCAQAESLLVELDMAEAVDAESHALRQTLELAAAGLIELTDDLASRARSLIEALDEQRRHETQAAAALVLEQTLKDLGFTVEPIAETLFMEGGAAHFTRPEWGQYAVRLRAAPNAATLNFNVVREPAEGDALSAAIRDAHAEEAWCAHIPRLSKTLNERGIGLKVTRLLGAGEAPAQVVPTGTLDRLQTPATAPSPAARPLQRSLD
ncbi:MAG: hypothetical protein ACJ8G7_18195 [Rhizobacter sp.]